MSPIQQMFLAAGGGGGPAGTFHIMMGASGAKGSTNTAAFGNAGSSSWTTANATGTGANGRTSFGSGEGLYNDFFSTTGITWFGYIIFTNTGSMNSANVTLAQLEQNFDPTTGGWADTSIFGSNTKIAMYKCKEGPGGSSGSDVAMTLSLYHTLKDIDTKLSNNQFTNDSNVATQIHGTDHTKYNRNSTNSICAGTLGFTGERSGASLVNGAITFTEKFCVWGINYDSDNDTQVCCFYDGTLATGNGKADSWRGNTPYMSFWSYWGDDFHSNSTDQRIGNNKQTDPGYHTNNANSGTNGGNSGHAGQDFYLIAFKPS